ncbi:d48ae6e6-b57f-4a0f-968a-df55c9d5f32e [Sclerotinia trifoliorum]|uniref:D48ae6e6-b57f-4a0f-968a-df55c9d5f32e n=1 Tax=Sclerotinia trifoliorum TaxID=28548 RepID=A0A8H2ZVT2_9HELO|nr:d48ae6e6-b57f-4a0f-968a-df55c9d5f32e [Sclerotinia trifoliorum]
MASLELGTATSTIFNVDKEKYGPSRVFINPVDSTSTASGWSPTGHLPKGVNLKTIQEENRIEDFQRFMLYNFTVRELVDLDVVSGRILEGPLMIPIHPIFSKNVWEQYGQRPLHWPQQTPEVIKGGWFYLTNVYVFKAMMPVLTLASAFLSRMHAVPFVDALLLGPRNPMDQHSSSLPLPTGLCTFWRRIRAISNANNFAECEKAFSTAMKKLHKKVKWAFAPGDHMPWDKVPGQGSSCFGVTHEGKDCYDKDVIWIFIDQRLCDILLRTDLTSGEKAGAQYLLAIVMCHELTHALWYAIQDQKLNQEYEPFFEDSPQCELGYEMENSVFGGLVEPVFHAPAAPFAYAMGSTYPNYGSMGQRIPKTLIMDKAKPYNNQIFCYFISIQTLEDLSNQSFWDTAIRRYGFSVIHARSIKHGWKSDFEPDWADVDEYGVPDYETSENKRTSNLKGIPYEMHGELTEAATSYHAKQLPAVRKASFKVLQAIIGSAAGEEQFYDFTQSQEDALWDVREAFVSLREARDRNDESEHERLAFELIKMLDQAITNHKESFLLLEKSETFRGGEKFRDRRATLFRWNIGTRRLLNDLFTLIEEVPNKEGDIKTTFQKLTYLLCKLEYVRLQIFPPTSSWDFQGENSPEGIKELKRWPNNFFSEELAEINFMATLWSAAEKFDSVLCHDLAEGRLKANRDASTLSFYCRFICVNLLMIIKDDFWVRNWKERKVEVDEMLSWLEKMQDGCSQFWKGLFFLWGNWFRKIGGKSKEEEKWEEEERIRIENIMLERRKRRVRY